MNESRFIDLNRHKWEELETLLSSKERDPDRLQQLFIQVSSDLSYARTYYPNRTVRVYLNQLSQRVMDLMTTRQSSWQWSQVSHYYRHALATELWRSRYALLAALIVFAVAVLIGIVSTAHDINFAKVVLGDRYVSLTEANINKGDPMAIYKSSEQLDMFLGITLNNIKVAFLAFVLGLLGAVGSGIILTINGIMLGTFQFFFYKKGLFLTSFLTIWIHGTIEISAIIIAGAAGFVLGDGLLHPKTYDRSLALQVASRRSVRILLGTVPLFVIAGFLESFVTRLTDLPIVVKGMIIGGSALFIIYHFIIYPYLYHRDGAIDDTDYGIDINARSIIDLTIRKYRNYSDVVLSAMSQLRYSIPKMVGHILIPTALFLYATLWLVGRYWTLTEADHLYDHYDTLLYGYDNCGNILFMAYWALSIYCCIVLLMIFTQEDLQLNQKINRIQSHGLPVAILTLIPLGASYYLPWWGSLIVLLVLSPQYWYGIMWGFWSSAHTGYEAVRQYGRALIRWPSYIAVFAMMFFLFLMLLLILNTSIFYILNTWIQWHSSLIEGIYTDSFFRTLFHVGMVIMVFAFGLYGYVYQIESLRYQEHSIDLLGELDDWSPPSSPLAHSPTDIQ